MFEIDEANMKEAFHNFRMVITIYVSIFFT